MGAKMISGENVILGHLVPADKEPLFDWINNAELVRYNAPFRPVDWQSHSSWFDNIGKDSSRIIFAIRTKADPRIIGIIQLFAIHSVHRSAELIMRIGNEEDKGKGYGTEAVFLLMKFAWNDLNLTRVFLHVFADNARAIAVYKKAGFEEEGRLRGAAFINGEWKDMLLMACLRSK